MTDFDKDIWRPLDIRGPLCRYTYNEEICLKSGTHHCHPRARRVVDFFATALRHTAGPLARNPFILEPWQETEIIHPLFGEVHWSDDWQQYSRRFEVAIIVMARKNGKSALASGVVLYMLVGDFEESAEVYGAAADKAQAGKVYDPSRRMKDLSPYLTDRLKENKAHRKIRDEPTNSGYEIIAADALSALGHNPHCFILDEVISQPNRDLWDSLRTAAGARAQPLFFAITTEVSDDSSFGAKMIDEGEAIQNDPASSPHTFAWVRKTPDDVDPWDESKWQLANPALGTFKSIEGMRKQAEEAKNDPEKENSFRQFQLNQRVQQVTRWMPMKRWMSQGEALFDEFDLLDAPCFSGLDIASTTDLASLVHLFPQEDGTYKVLWRFWTPEAMIPKLDDFTAGLATAWARQGLIYVTNGDWIDYFGDSEGESPTNLMGVPTSLAIHPKIKDDFDKFDIKVLGYDRAQATATAQYMDNELNMDIKPITQGFALSPGLKEIMRRTKAQVLSHGNHPVANWNMDAAEVKRDNNDRIQIVKPNRGSSKKRIDGVVALANAIQAEMTYEEKEDEELDILNSVF